MPPRLPTRPYLQNLLQLKPQSLSPYFRFNTSVPPRLEASEEKPEPKSDPFTNYRSPYQVALSPEESVRKYERRKARWENGKGRVLLSGPRNVMHKKVLLEPTSELEAEEFSISPGISPPEVPKAARLRYHVERTGSNMLPVYLDLKAGKTLKQTRIRKIVGEPRVLRDDLVKALALDPVKEKAEVGAVTGHIVIKGYHRERVMQFLTEQGF